jgi:hypothetical protein
VRDEAGGVLLDRTLRARRHSWYCRSDSESDP